MRRKCPGRSYSTRGREGAEQPATRTVVECWWSAREARILQGHGAWRTTLWAKSRSRARITARISARDGSESQSAVLGDAKLAMGSKPVMAMVGIVMGSDTDFPVMSEAGKT